MILLLNLSIQKCKKETSFNKSSASLEQKLCSYILYTGSDDYFKTNYTHLATYLGVTHRHLLRVFRSLIIKEVLRKTDKGYEILNKKELIKRSGDLYL